MASVLRPNYSSTSAKLLQYFGQITPVLQPNYSSTSAKYSAEKSETKADFEQRAIATYFRHIDSLIETADKKVASLKQVKEASLQSMFPKEGQKVPEVRFKGFEGGSTTDSNIRVKNSKALRIIRVENVEYREIFV